MTTERRLQQCREASARWRAKHPKRWAEVLAQHRRKKSLEQPSRVMLERIALRARRDSIPFAITVRDLRIPKRCPYLGLPLRAALAGKNGPRALSPSADRKIPELGYIPGNVHVVSHIANASKGTRTDTEYRAWLSTPEGREFILSSRRHLKGTL